jgi:predicted GIY-YIG superfamily endonuclease
VVVIVVPANAGTHNHRVRCLAAKPRACTYYVYILASGKHGTLYIGVTNNVRTRLE